MTGATFSHVHQSGLWDASEANWSWAVHHATRAASVATFTETTSHKPQPPTDWRAYHGGKQAGADEATILWDTRVWTPAARGEAVPVSRTVFALGNGKPRPDIHLTYKPLRHVTGRVVIFGVVHTPSAVEGNGGLVEGFRRAVAYRETLAGVTTIRRQLRKQYPGCEFVIAGDWNLNVRLSWVRALLRSSLPGLRSSWRKLPAKPRGTHGSRVIDDARHSKGLAVEGSSTLMRRPTGFDHTPLRTNFRFRAPSRRNNAQ